MSKPETDRLVKELELEEARLLREYANDFLEERISFEGLQKAVLIVSIYMQVTGVFKHAENYLRDPEEYPEPLRSNLIRDRKEFSDRLILKYADIDYTIRNLDPEFVGRLENMMELMKDLYRLYV